MNDQRRQAAIEAGARALAGVEPGEDWPTNSALGGHALLGTRDDEYRDAMREQAAAVIDAALPHLAPDVETIAATLALAYGGHVSPPRGGRDWKAAEAVHALLVPVDAP